MDQNGREIHTSFTQNAVLMHYLFMSGEIFAFNVEVPPAISKMAASRSVPLRMHNVIYHLFDELRDSMSARLPTIVEENVIGELTG